MNYIRLAHSNIKDITDQATRFIKQFSDSAPADKMLNNGNCKAIFNE